MLTRRRSAGASLLLSVVCWLAASPASGQNAILGTINFPNSGSPAAQPYFIEGVKCLHSFEWEDAADRFRKAQQADPGFALAYWGEALSHTGGHHYPMQQDMSSARKALVKLAATRAERLAKAPTERERLRALAAVAAREPDTARGVARANGWERRLERARTAFDRSTELRHPAVLAELRARETFGVTELEVFADCSSIWLVDRRVGPRTIDPQVDARLRGTLAHQALYKFFSGLPKRLGSDRVEPERLADALAFLGECLDDTLESGLWLELTDLQRNELAQGLRRDLEHFVRKEAESGLSLVPRRFEILFGSDRSAPELQSGLELDGFALSGKIDRIDLDPFSARGIVQDYKSGKTAFSAAKIESELKLQIPLYMLVMRDLVGIEPLGGLYRALSGERPARGLLRKEAKADLPGFSSKDYLDEEEFWAQVETARDRASALVGRIREGDIAHDPKGGFPCPSWCELWSMCRVPRA